MLQRGVQIWDSASPHRRPKFVSTADLPDHGLAAGAVKPVSSVYEGGPSYQFEFTIFEGSTVAVAQVSATGFVAAETRKFTPPAPLK